MLFLYRLLLYLALPLLAARLLWRAWRDRRYFTNLPARLGIGIEHCPPGGVWLHAVSVGEVNAAAPLVHHLLARHPQMRITITTMTPTGADRVRALFDERVMHCWLPYDYPGAARRFLRARQPRLGVVMETEIWPNFIHACARAKMPLMYVNVRLSKRSHRGYRRFRRLIAPTLRRVAHFAAQSQADAARLIELGAPPNTISVTGNLKFDIAPKASIVEMAHSVRRDLGADRPVWIAGSTHDGEEAQVLDAFTRVQRRFAALLLVIAPRHPHRFAQVLRLCRQRNFRVVLRSEAAQAPPDAEVYIADSMGELPMLLAASDVAFIGGSLTEVGGHNVLEPAAVGVPVVFGRYMFNFTEIANLLLAHDAGIQINNADELAKAIARLLGDAHLRDQTGERGRALIAANRGALRRVCRLIDERLAG